MNNSKFITITFVMTIFLEPVYADQFQIIESSSGSPVGNVKVVVDNSQYFTDSHGRISVNLPQGAYKMQVHKGNGSSQMNVQIDNSNYLKKLYVD